MKVQMGGADGSPEHWFGRRKRDMSRASNKPQSQRPSETMGWSQEDIELVKQNRRAAMEERDEFPDVLEASVPPKDWAHSIWLKLGTGTVAIPAYLYRASGLGRLTPVQTPLPNP